MKNILNPNWIFIINSVPILLIFFLFYGEYTIISTLLEEENIKMWKIFGGSLFLLGISNILYAVFLNLTKKKVSIYYGFITLVGHISFIYLYSEYFRDIFPFSIPRWMIPDQMNMYVGTFLMPTLVYSLVILVYHFTLETKNYKVWKNLLYAAFVPISWYVLSQVIQPLWKPIGYQYRQHVLMIFIIIGSLLFLFFLIRGLYILITRKSAIWKKYELAWKIPLTIILPLLGLGINNGWINDFNGVFGDFSNYWFYSIALINGVLISLPTPKNKVQRLYLFIARSITFSFIVYFFFVFLPVLPLSVVAILVFGLGILMLTPLLVFIIQINELYKDYIFLKDYFSKTILWSLAILGFLVIPIALTSSYFKDKRILNESISYIYSPDYAKTYAIDTVSLQKTLKIIKKNKERNRDQFFGSQTPFLSSYFNWIVLDNLTLSDAKINTIERVFFDKKQVKLRSEQLRNKNVKISNIATESHYDTSQQAWKSWINLEITNNTDSNLSEYATIIELPDGCWISDYYLYVGDRKEMGILAEKKAAMWIFSQIRNTNRDPGLLHYLTGNKVSFRVFPFTKREVRKTGIEFLHKAPIQLNIDGNTVNLGTENSATTSIETANSIYVSKSEKKNLKQVKRNAYFHFLVDISKDQIDNTNIIISNIEKVITEHPTLAENAKISFVNSYVTTINFDKNWKNEVNNQIFEGGYYLDRAIKKTLIQSYKTNTKTYPILVSVTDQIENAIIENDFSDIKITFPESNYFYNLKADATLEKHSLVETPQFPISASIFDSLENLPVLEYTSENGKSYYIAANNQASIILKNTDFSISKDDIKEKNWQSALHMQVLWQAQIFEPEKSNDNWLSLVKYSFISKVMTPFTSYIVVENEAQKAMLKKKQEQALSGNKNFDLGEESQRMSEPSTYILVGIFLLFLYFKRL